MEFTQEVRKATDPIYQKISKIMPEIEWSVHAPYIHRINQLKKEKNAIIDWGDEWSFFPGNSAPISNWQDPNTNISSWSTGNSGFGYGDNDDNTNISQVLSVYVRKDFWIDDASIISKALFHLDYDDGYVAYLNGVEFSRRNLGAPGSPVYYNTTTTALHEAEIYSGGFPEQITIDLDQNPLLSGSNTLAIEVHNQL